MNLEELWKREVLDKRLISAYHQILKFALEGDPAFQLFLVLTDKGSIVVETISIHGTFEKMLKSIGNNHHISARLITLVGSQYAGRKVNEIRAIWRKQIKECVLPGV